jgi:protein-S-isoprenylcysteine O-methyltransferase Ste14
MQRTLFFAYGLACYQLFFASYAYFACFVGNLFVPRTFVYGSSAPLAWAAAIDVALLLAFGLQHSLMARPAFKARWTRFVPAPIERSTYVLASCLALIGLMWLWRPLDVVIWNVSNPVGWWLATALFATGWLLVPLVSLAINHFDLFGVGGVASGSSPTRRSPRTRRRTTGSGIRCISPGPSLGRCRRIPWATCLWPLSAYMLGPPASGARTSSPIGPGVPRLRAKVPACCHRACLESSPGV